MANLAALRQAYEGRTAFASAMTDDHDDAEHAWAALRAILDAGNVATLASKVYFRACSGAPLYTVTLDTYGRATCFEVAS